MTNELATGTTRSQYTANGMTVAIDWAPIGEPVTLKAIVSTPDGVAHHTLTQDETRYIVHKAQDYRGYAKAYHDMIS